MLAMIGGLGMQELIIILVILLLLFGSTRLPQLARGMGKSIREFKKGIGEGGDEAELDAANRERLSAGEAARAPTTSPPSVSRRATGAKRRQKAKGKRQKDGEHSGSPTFAFYLFTFAFFSPPCARRRAWP